MTKNRFSAGVEIHQKGQEATLVVLTWLNGETKTSSIIERNQSVYVGLREALIPEYSIKIYPHTQTQDCSL